MHSNPLAISRLNERHLFLMNTTGFLDVRNQLDPAISRHQPIPFSDKISFPGRHKQSIVFETVRYSWYVSRDGERCERDARCEREE